VEKYVRDVISEGKAPADLIHDSEQQGLNWTIVSVALRVRFLCEGPQRRTEHFGNVVERSNVPVANDLYGVIPDEFTRQRVAIEDQAEHRK